MIVLFPSNLIPIGDAKTIEQIILGHGGRRGVSKACQNGQRVFGMNVKIYSSLMKVMKRDTRFSSCEEKQAIKGMDHACNSGMSRISGKQSAKV